MSCSTRIVRAARNRRILRHLRKFELHHARVPLAIVCRKRRVKRRRIELLHGIRPRRGGQRVAARPPHGDDFDADISQFLRHRPRLFDKSDQHLIEIARRAAHQVIDPHRGAMRKRKREIGARDQHHRLARRLPSRKNGDVAIDQVEEIRVGTAR